MKNTIITRNYEISLEALTSYERPERQHTYQVFDDDGLVDFCDTEAEAIALCGHNPNRYYI